MFGIEFTSNFLRYALQFFQESKEEIEEKKRLAREEIKPVTEKELEISIENYFPLELDFPKRPPWDFSMSREHLDARENKYFRVSILLNSLLIFCICR